MGSDNDREEGRAYEDDNCGGAWSDSGGVPYMDADDGVAFRFGQLSDYGAEGFRVVSGILSADGNNRPSVQDEANAQGQGSAQLYQDIEIGSGGNDNDGAVAHNGIDIQDHRILHDFHWHRLDVYSVERNNNRVFVCNAEADL